MCGICVFSGFRGQSSHPRCYQQPAQRHYPAPYFPSGDPAQPPGSPRNDAVRLRHDAQEQQGSGGYPKEGVRCCGTGSRGGEERCARTAWKSTLLERFCVLKCSLLSRWTTKEGISSIWLFKTRTSKASCSSSAFRLT